MNIYNLNLVISIFSLLGTISVKGVIVSNNIGFCSESTTLVGPQLVLTTSKTCDSLNLGKEIQQIIPLTLVQTEQATIQAKLALNNIRLVVLNEPVFDVLPAELGQINDSKNYFYISNENLEKTNSFQFNMLDDIDSDKKTKILVQPEKYITRDLYKFIYFKFSDGDNPISGRGLLKQRDKNSSFFLSGILCVDSEEYSKNFNEIHYRDRECNNINDAVTYLPVVKSLEKIKGLVGMVYELTNEDIGKVHYLNLKIALQSLSKPLSRT